MTLSMVKWLDVIVATVWRNRFKNLICYKLRLKLMPAVKSAVLKSAGLLIGRPTKKSYCSFLMLPRMPMTTPVSHLPTNKSLLGR